jgi:hypothetical protein
MSFYMVYKTTNTINNRFYIGVHKTHNLCDSYLGSGKVLNTAILKYGIHAFKRDILFIFCDEISAFVKEEELVAYHISNPMCYNLRKGGSGGFDYINKNRLWDTPQAKIKRVASRRPISEEGMKRIREAQTGHIAWNRGRKMPEGFGRRIADMKRGKPRPSSVRRAVAEANKGRAPVKWINKDGIAKKVKVFELDEYIKNGWKFGRK